MIMWRKMLVRILFCLVGCMSACDTTQGAETLEGNGGATASAIPAFPGAEGFGARATGGRGGKVYLVETLDDYNPNEGEKPIPGSLRAAIPSLACRIPRSLVFVDVMDHPIFSNHKCSKQKYMPKCHHPFAPTHS